MYVISICHLLDLSMLVDMQQESLDVIENRIERAQAHVNVGYENIQQASDYQNKARRVSDHVMLRDVMVTDR